MSTDYAPLRPTPEVPGSSAAVRRRFWTSPQGQPPWARPALLAIATLAGLLYAWNWSESGYATYYAMAVKSMSVSWKAFFFGALDPGATVTIDKLAGAFVPQALSVRLFGFHQWALALPQVIEGVLAVLVMYRVVRRWAGPVQGITAAAIFALTPVLASMYAHSMEDGALTLFLVLAASAYQSAVLSGRLRSLLLAGVWIGVGFQVKMLAVWLIVPALALAYLVAAPGSVRRRLGHVVAAGVVAVAVSASWMVAFALTPAADRPYVDGTTNNNIFSMVLGYNGLDRLGLHVAGAARSEQAAAGTEGPGKLLGHLYGTQVGWLYPLALVSLGVGLAAWRGRRRTDRRGAGFLMWGGWLLSVMAILSKMTIPHVAYVAMLAPPVAALSGAGLVLLWRRYKAGGRGRILLPATAGVEAVWVVYLASAYSHFLSWLIVGVILTAAVAVALLVATPFSERITAETARRLQITGLSAAVATMLVMPAAWGISVLDPTYAGSAFDAGAGPAGSGSWFKPGGSIADMASMFSGQQDSWSQTGSGNQNWLMGASGQNAADWGEGAAAWSGGGQMPAGLAPFSGLGFGNLVVFSTGLTAQQRGLLDYVRAHRSGAKYLLAGDSWFVAGPYLLATGDKVLSLGGFYGLAQAPSPERFQRMVAGGELRYVLVGGKIDAVGFAIGAPEAGPVAEISTWVRANCAAVPPQEYGGAVAQQADTKNPWAKMLGSATLYGCGSHA